MLLEKSKSLCGKNQKEIVSKDMRSRSKHHAHNKSLNNVRQYKLDGVVITNQSCCDYLLLNDSKGDAYLIELKGRDITKGIKQLEAGAFLSSNDLINYTIHYRLIYSKARSHSVESNDFRNFKKKYKAFFKYKENLLEEEI